MAWRPRNETTEDLQREEAAAKTLAEAWGVEVIKLSEALYGVDWAFSRDNKVVAFGEFKTRFKKYDTALLSFAKYSKLYNLHKLTGLPALLIIQWPDELCYWEVDDEPLKSIGVGRNSRGQNGDTEPVIYIDVNKFRQVGNG